MRQFKLWQIGLLASILSFVIPFELQFDITTAFCFVVILNAVAWGYLLSVGKSWTDNRANLVARSKDMLLAYAPAGSTANPVDIIQPKKSLWSEDSEIVYAIDNADLDMWYETSDGTVYEYANIEDRRKNGESIPDVWLHSNVKPVTALIDGNLEYVKANRTASQLNAYIALANLSETPVVPTSDNDAISQKWATLMKLLTAKTQAANDTNTFNESATIYRTKGKGIEVLAITESGCIKIASYRGGNLKWRNGSLDRAIALLAK